MLKLKQIKDDDGILVPIEFNEIVPFCVQRIFYVTGVPAGEERGNHAHYRTQQLLICIQGRIVVKLYNGKTHRRFTLLPGQFVHVDRMIWDSQIFETGHDILLSLCSTNYDFNDYIIDKEEFRRLVSNES
jgi:dTDP-4-dehydrorhamnose 3,5-epimerase